MKQFVLGFVVCMIMWLVVLSMIEIPEYTVIREVICI